MRSRCRPLYRIINGRTMQEIGFTHMRILEGVGTLIQLGGLMARLCKMYVPSLDVWTSKF